MNKILKIIDPPERLNIKYKNLYRAMTAGFILFFILLPPIIYFEETGADDTYYGYFFLAYIVIMLGIGLANIIANKIIFRSDRLALYPFNKNKDLIEQRSKANMLKASIPLIVLALLLLYLIIFRPFN